MQTNQQQVIKTLISQLKEDATRLNCRIIALEHILTNSSLQENSARTPDEPQFEKSKKKKSFARAEQWYHDVLIPNQKQQRK